MGVGPATEDLDLGQRKHGGAGPEVLPERYAGSRGRSVGDRERGGHDGIAAQALELGRAVEQFHGGVAGRLVVGVEPDQRRPDQCVDCLDRVFDTQTPEPGPTVATVERLAAPGGGAGRRDGSAAAGARLDENFDGGAPPRVPPSMAADGHDRRISRGHQPTTRPRSHRSTGMVCARGRWPGPAPWPAPRR